MTDSWAVPSSAAELRRLNALLDNSLLQLLRRTTPTVGGRAAGAEWSVQQVAAHLSEFPRYFANDLRRWQSDRAAVVGRTHEHPQRLAAVNDPSVHERDVESQVASVQSALEELAAALAQLSDDDLTAPTVNAKYGQEPLSAFLDRYVITHKRGHVAQLDGLMAGDAS